MPKKSQARTNLTSFPHNLHSRLWDSLLPHLWSENSCSARPQSSESWRSCVIASYHVIAFHIFSVSWNNSWPTKRQLRQLIIDSLILTPKKASLWTTGGSDICNPFEIPKAPTLLLASSRFVDLSKWTKRGFTQISPGVISSPLPKGREVGVVTKTRKSWTAGESKSETKGICWKVQNRDSKC